MAGIDILGKFPNSRMANAARLGQSRFISGEDVVVPGVPSALPNPNAAGGVQPITIVPGFNAKSGVLTITGAATTTTANLLTDAGFTTAFTEISITINTSTAGVTLAQGGNSIVLKAGSSIGLSGPINATNSPITLTTATGDVVDISYTGA
jgi:hypothetical protein